MNRLTLCTVIGAAASLCAATAQAADLPPPDFPMVVDKPVIQGFASGWYIRGDVGYRLNRVDGASTALGDIIAAHSIDDGAVFGLGAGYKAGWLRADVTVDYAGSASFKADTVPAPLVGQPGLATKIEMVTTLANLYADLGTWWGFTPYVGAGAGMSYLRAKDFYDAVVPAMRTADSEKWNFAWALIGGLSYRVGANLVADASYRWLHLGDAVSGLNAAGNQLTVKDLTAHEFRIGLRYELD